MSNRTILHCDMNNFYASVECLYHPELRGKPVAVAGDPEQRHGIVLAKNYEAKKYGIKTGNPLWMARQLCKDIVFVSPHYEQYLRYSAMAREIYLDYTDQVEPFGLDECWLDVSGSTDLFGDGQTIADTIRERIRCELGVTASVGVSFNKIFAKLGSDLRKPDATTVIPQDHFHEIVWPLPACDLLYVGKATDRKLQRYGIHTIGDLACTERKILKSIFGVNGELLWAFANGLDTSPVSKANAPIPVKSIGNSTTTPRNLTSEEDVRIILYVLAESVAERLRDSHTLCDTVQVHFRDASLDSYERQCKLEVPSANSTALHTAAFTLYKQHHDLRSHPIRSIGLRACGLSEEGSAQLSLLPNAQRSQKRDTLEHTVDGIRGRFGHYSIQRGILLKDKGLSHLDPKHDHIIHPVGFLK